MNISVGQDILGAIHGGLANIGFAGEVGFG